MRNRNPIDRAAVIKHVCEALERGGPQTAASIAITEYPFEPPPDIKRKTSPETSLRIFARDGFLDRYSGDKLIFPGTLKILSLLMPKEFPYHPNWKATECHLMYWELLPTLDHVQPLARGGTDTPDNLVTTSMLRNAIKANWTLKETGWKLRRRGNLDKWDGLLNWFLKLVGSRPELLTDSYVRRWFRAASKVFPK
ncbi:MAG: HNH endonuclease [Verrucomicrobia bacterium]|nr:HNH endonuclease [Verrucomicrobiota bacterium]